VTDPQPAPPAPAGSGRAAFVISQTYYYVVAVVGVGLLLGGGIAALIALRQWVLPSEGFGSDVETSRNAVRSFLGGLAFAITGAAILVTHLREARRREGGVTPGAHWGSSLYFHLVAFVSLMIAVGGVIGLFHSLIDAALPECYAISGPLSDGYVIPAEGTPIAEISPAPPVRIDVQEECYPESSDALRSALDAAIVSAVAGGVWLWHLTRGRRVTALPPPAD
jgi:hypothetical protein